MFCKIFFVISGRIAIISALSSFQTIRSPIKILNNSISNTAVCPSQSTFTQESQNIKQYLNKDHWFCPCGCGSPAWTKVALFNYSTQQCTQGTDRFSIFAAGCWRMHEATISFPVHGVNYSAVCGRVMGTGFGEAFHPAIANNRTIEERYMDGISLTHGLPGHRRHIWSFAVAFTEQYSFHTSYICPCTNTNITWPHKIPEFVENNFFCGTNIRMPQVEAKYSILDPPDYSDVLWDSEKCGPTSSCCSFNNPPYFCSEFNYTTNEDMELRLFGGVPVSFVEIYVKEV